MNRTEYEALLKRHQARAMAAIPSPYVYAATGTSGPFISAEHTKFSARVNRVYIEGRVGAGDSEDAIVEVQISHLTMEQYERMMQALAEPTDYERITAQEAADQAALDAEPFIDSCPCTRLGKLRREPDSDCPNCGGRGTWRRN